MALTQTAKPTDERIAAATRQTIDTEGPDSSASTTEPERSYNQAGKEARSLAKHVAARIIFSEGGVNLDGLKDEFRGQNLLRKAFGHSALNGKASRTYVGLSFPGAILEDEEVQFWFGEKDFYAPCGTIVIAAYRLQGQAHQVGLLFVESHEFSGEHYEHCRPICRDREGRQPVQVCTLAIAASIRIVTRINWTHVGGDRGLVFNPDAGMANKKRLMRKDQKRYWHSFERFAL